MSAGVKDYFPEIVYSKSGTAGVRQRRKAPRAVILRAIAVARS
jgi:hypothetical protein